MQGAASRPKRLFLLLRQPGGFEGVGAMAENFELLHDSLLNDGDLEQVGFNRDTALPAASARLAHQGENPIVRRLNALQKRETEVVPETKHLLPKSGQCWKPSNVLRRVRHELPAVPSYSTSGSKNSAPIPARDSLVRSPLANAFHASYACRTTSTFPSDIA
jgi:hypothetical protein